MQSKHNKTDPENQVNRVVVNAVDGREWAESVSAVRDNSDTHWPLRIKVARETLKVQGWQVERWAIKAVETARTAGSAEAESVEFEESGEHWIAAPDLVLFDDERAAYRFNLNSDDPRLFVVCDDPQDAEQPPEPVLVTLSQDEAASYLDGEDQLVFSTPLPPAIHCWTEAFIGRHGEPDLGLSRGKRRRYRDKGEKAHG